MRDEGAAVAQAGEFGGGQDWRTWAATATGEGARIARLPHAGARGQRQIAGGIASGYKHWTSAIKKPRRGEFGAKWYLVMEYALGEQGGPTVEWR